jgi:hypothetical protein
MEPIIIDNCLPKLYFDNLVRRVTDWEKVPYVFISRTGNNNGRSDILDSSHANLVFNRGNHISPLYDLLYDALLIILDSAGWEIEKLIRIRIGLITAQKENFQHEPHVDFQFSHKTVLLYLNSVDGFTTLYNEFYDPANIFKFEDKMKLTVQQTIRPEANRAVLFDGFQFHSSSTPTTHQYRLVVNFNFK